MIQNNHIRFYRERTKKPLALGASGCWYFTMYCKIEDKKIPQFHNKGIPK